MTRIKHSLWRVSNGWLLVPEGTYSSLADSAAPECAVFKTLKEFSEWKPKQKRNRKIKPLEVRPVGNPNINKEYKSHANQS